jgi:hypothetical protein
MHARKTGAMAISSNSVSNCMVSSSLVPSRCVVRRGRCRYRSSKPAPPRRAARAVRTARCACTQHCPTAYTFSTLPRTASLEETLSGTSVCAGFSWARRAVLRRGRRSS